jgi:hypothetical protein
VKPVDQQYRVTQSKARPSIGATASAAYNVRVGVAGVGLAQPQHQTRAALVAARRP